MPVDLQVDLQINYKFLRKISYGPFQRFPSLCTWLPCKSEIVSGSFSQTRIVNNPKNCKESYPSLAVHFNAVPQLGHFFSKDSFLLVNFWFLKMVGNALPVSNIPPALDGWKRSTTDGFSGRFTLRFLIGGYGPIVGLWVSTSMTFAFACWAVDWTLWTKVATPEVQPNSKKCKKRRMNERREANRCAVHIDARLHSTATRSLLAHWWGSNTCFVFVTSAFQTWAMIITLDNVLNVYRRRCDQNRRFFYSK